MNSIIDYKRRGYSDALSRNPVNPFLPKRDPEYLHGYREGLAKMVEWANEELELFDKEYTNI